MNNAEKSLDGPVHALPVYRPEQLVVGEGFSESERRMSAFVPSRAAATTAHSAEVDYAELLPSMFMMNAGYFLMQVASEKDKEQVYKLCGKYSREDANGVAQICFIGVINPLHRKVETPQEVRCDLLLASKHIPKERLGSTDDCGFSPFSIDVKPRHGSPDLAREIAFKKYRLVWKAQRWLQRSSAWHKTLD